MNQEANIEKQDSNGSVIFDTIAIIGLGLIGGSIAKAVQKYGLGNTLIGVDLSTKHQEEALNLQLIDRISSLESAIEEADLIVLATPVDVMVQLLPQILDLVTQQVVIDVGSTKTKLIEAIAKHPNRGQFVATHPMAGTEFSGPKAAIDNLFENKCVVLCDKEHSSPKAVKQVETFYTKMKMKISYLNPVAHDVHTAYVSHISHISSFALALTVLEKEKDEKQIFELASGGFDSTVRLAKSSPDMWVPIFKQNREHVLDVLDEHINTLAKFRSLLIKNDFEKFYQLIEEANTIQRILK